MKIFPAIDLRQGQVVRLSEGDYGRMDVYNQDPLAVAEQFLSEGAQNLHLVDLDGAKDGTQANFRVVERIARRGGLFIQVGGGARDEDSVERYLGVGVDRVILGTMAVAQPELASCLAAKHPGRIAAGVDAKGGKVAIRGWREVTDIDSFDFMRRLPAMGIEVAIYTDIARDGMLQGTNMHAYQALSGIEGLKVIASGGVSSERDIRELRELDVHGAIIGKALYTGNLTLKRAIELAGGAI